MNEQQLIEQRAAIWQQMQAIQTRSALGMTAEDREQWDRLDGELTSLTADIQRCQRAASLASVDFGAIIDAPESRDDETPDVDTEYRDAFVAWSRFGTEELTPAQRAVLRSGALSEDTRRELRAAGVGTGAAGGFTVTPLFRDKLVETLRFFSGVRQEAEGIQTDTGASLPWMRNDDTANVGAIVGENAQVTEQDLGFGTASLDAFMYTSLITRISLQLIQDSALDLEAFLPRKLGERIGRIQNRHFTTGTGTGQPLGLITGGTAVQAAVGNATAFTYDELINATARLDPAYLASPDLAWMGSQAALASFRKLKDSQGRPLWEPSLQVGNPDTLLGYRFVMNNDMAVPAASAKSLAFGDFKAGYVVRDVSQVQQMRLVERYAEFLQVGFQAFQRAGGTVQDTSAYTVLQHSAT